MAAYETLWTMLTIRLPRDDPTKKKDNWTLRNYVSSILYLYSFSIDVLCNLKTITTAFLTETVNVEYIINYEAIVESNEKLLKQFH